MNGWRRLLATEHAVDVETNPAEALFSCRRGQLRSADRFRSTSTISTA